MTAVQDTLFGDPPDRELTIRERFSIFHVQNPQVFREIERMTETMVARGRKKIGIAMLFEVMRWNYYMTTSDPNSDWKLNNDYRAYYARLLIDEHPEWTDLFSLRAVHEESAFLVRRKP